MQFNCDVVTIVLQHVRDVFKIAHQVLDRCLWEICRAIHAPEWRVIGVQWQYQCGFAVLAGNSQN